MPKVSIIVPCYNQAQYLNEALQSVLAQTYTNWECIIVNDGSPDNTEELAKKWVEKDNRFIYLYKENGGLSSARNAGITVAIGEFILPVDADDKIAPNYIELAVTSFQKDVSLKVVYCKAELFGEEKGLWQLQLFSLFDLARTNMIFCTAMFRKQDWELAGGYDEKMLYGWEDWEFWIAILKNGGGVRCLDDVGFYYRIKPSSMVKELDDEKSKYLLEYMSIKHVDFFIKQIGSFTQLNKTIDNQKNKDIQWLTLLNLMIPVFTDDVRKELLDNFIHNAKKCLQYDDELSIQTQLQNNLLALHPNLVVDLIQENEKLKSQLNSGQAAFEILKLKFKTRLLQLMPGLTSKKRSVTNL